MKTFLSLIICIVITNSTFAQDKIYYYINPANSLMGVKNSSGEIIIPVKYKYLYQNADELNARIAGPTIYMSDWESLDSTKRTLPALSAGDVYDRKGNLLYHPMQYDNGADFFTEELTRCVDDHHKIGFANRDGKIVIEPQYDWVSQFNYGYAFACKGCSLNREVDEEHPSMVFQKGADTFYINKEGKRVKPTKTPGNYKDHKIDGLYFPYPFSYTPSEQKLVDSFNDMEVISKIAFMNFPPIERDERYVQFEIMERPTSVANTYKLMGYTRNYGYYTALEDLVFLVDGQGNWYYDGRPEGKIAFASWVSRSLKECKEYFKNNPDAPNKFDVDKYVKTSHRR